MGGIISRIITHQITILPSISRCMIICRIVYISGTMSEVDSISELSSPSGSVSSPPPPQTGGYYRKSLLVDMTIAPSMQVYVASTEDYRVNRSSLTF